MSIALGLCMIVKNEENRIDGCLRNIVDLFEDIVIIDTGSTDRTRDILRSNFGIEPILKELEPEVFDLSDARNLAASLVKTPFIMTLDADERIERKALQTLIASTLDPESDGYFCAWNTYKRDQIIRDYKCVMFRNGLRMAGSLHENLQYHMRRHNMSGSWINGLTLYHYPEQRKSVRKIHQRINHLMRATEREPEWYRHHWFLGYTLFRQGNVDNALRYLTKASSSSSSMFPVECLNSKMIIAMIYANAGDAANTESILFNALELYEKFEQDFEVSFNTRLKPWFENALTKCSKARLSEIEAYEFCY